MTDQLGTLLRRLRAEAGLTQEEAAERSKLSVRTIRRLETGTATDHRLGTVNQLADALEVGPEDRQRLAALLAGAAGAPGPDPSVPVTEPLPGPPPPVRGALAEAAEELAREVRRRWQREEEHRRVQDPFPLPVRWRTAPPDLTDHEENIQRLPAGAGAGAPRMDLTGDLRGVAEVYRGVPSGRMVILGRAGSGKSILTIRFLLDQLAAPAPADRVPVIFSIGSWDPTADGLRDWLVDRLLRDHPYLTRRVPSGSTLAAALVDADLVLPVLDGFDEIAEGLRKEALEALNGVSMPLVLTSRRDEFADAVSAARAPLLWAAGVELTDLTLDDLAAYLPRTARPAAHGTGGPGAVWDLVLKELRSGTSRGSVNLARVLSTPLMVVLARTMYSETPELDPAELLDTARFPTAHALEQHLLAGFVPSVYRRRAPDRADRGRPRNWDPARAERWLGYLAHHMARADREQQDLAWWRIGDSLGRSTRLLAVVLVSGLCVAVSGWVVGLFAYQVTSGDMLLVGALMGPTAGLAFGAVHLVIGRFGHRAFEPTQVRLRMPGAGNGIGRRPLRTFAARFTTVLLGGFVIGVGCACALTLDRVFFIELPVTAELVEGTLINMLAFGMIFGSSAGLVFGLLAALEAPLDIASAATPGSLLSSNRATVRRQTLVLAPLLTLTVAFGGRIVVSLLQPLVGPLNWGLDDGLFIGAVGGLGGALSYALSFTAWGQWVTLSRIWLPLTGRLPWDTAAFLEDAYRRGVLRQTGAVYQFRHIRLQHHLGQLFRRSEAGYAPATLRRNVEGWAD
ncbi:helix-turn-helix domain-containing protein [Kitasatospora sp. NPDC101801]|uniref:helix-turn-helix domain-containing protein n=1 Tax=Kitasatospora sp. NPDC101801 TaxID=3364103 RepID=UPI00382FF205